jgi:hypothetical protein
LATLSPRARFILASAFPISAPNRTCRRLSKIDAIDPQRTSQGNYHCTGTDRPASHQYSPAVISPANGNSAVIGSAAQRRKNAKKFSIGGPESGPLLHQAINVSDTNTTAPSTNPSRQTLKLVDSKNLKIIYRWAEGQYDRLRMLAAELVAERVSVNGCFCPNASMISHQRRPCSRSEAAFASTENITILQRRAIAPPQVGHARSSSKACLTTSLPDIEKP